MGGTVKRDDLKRLNCAVLLAVVVGSAGCSGVDATGETVEQLESASHVHELGDPLPGISNAAFEAARAEFSRSNTTATGLGPIFNEAACSDCHDQGAIGGAGALAEHRFGRWRADGTFDALANEGGSLIQDHTLGQWVNAQGTSCNVPLEVEAADATLHTGRLPTPLFGLGLVDAMPNEFFEALAAAQPPAVRGTPLVADVKLPDPADPTQAAGGTRVGRFSWKGVVPSVMEFAAGAYLNEMGVTSQHCINGQSITAFAGELAPNGVQTELQCQDDVPGIDDPVGACDGGRTAIHENVEKFARFITFLAPPPPTHVAENERVGKRLFREVGCASCHVSNGFVTPEEPFNGVPGGYHFHPYSDYLGHEMGTLSDEIGNNGQTAAAARLMRTAPLWGVRFRPALLHDGRATSVEDAIVQHDGQAAAARDAFEALGHAKRKKLLRFVENL
jgi:CxxC motif-containing protein (DUF1111 family)